MRRGRLRKTLGETGLNTSFLDTPEAAAAWLAQQPHTSSPSFALCANEAAWCRRLVETVVLLSEPHLVALAAESEGRGFPLMDHPDTAVVFDPEKLRKALPVLAVGVSGPAPVGTNFLTLSLGASQVPALSNLLGAGIEPFRKAFYPVMDAGFHKKLQEPLFEALLRHDVGTAWHSEVRAWQLGQTLPAVPARRPSGPRF